MNTEHYAVLDIETRDSFMSVGAYDASKLQVSLVGLYTSKDDTYRTFLLEELETLWPYLEESTRVIGFNLDGFDYPVLAKYYSGDFKNIPTLDILTEFKNHHKFRIKLDTLVKENLGEGKSGDGLQAIRFWEKGMIDELKKYCLDDVRLTKDLFLYGLEKGVIYYPDKMGKRVSWLVDWVYKPKPENPALTLF